MDAKALRQQNNVWSVKYFAIAIGGLMALVIICHCVLRRFMSNSIFDVALEKWLLYTVYWSINLILILTNNNLNSLIYVAKRLGWISVANFVLLAFLAIRNTPLAPLSGTSYEKLRPLHKTAGYTCIATSVIHGVVYLNAWAQIDHLHEMGETSNLVGAIAGMAMVIIGISTIGWITRKYYELFYAIHLVMFLLIIILIGMHRPSFAKSTVIMVIFTACLWGADRLIRFTKLCWNMPGNYATLTPMIDGAVRVKLQRSLRGTPGSHAFLWMPSIRFFESHPFTVVSNSPVEFLIREYDGYTHDLIETARQQPGVRLRCSIDGPYGQVPNFGEFDHTILVAGGSGASFTFALALGVLKGNAANISAKTIDFIWSVKHSDSLKWFENELQQLQENPAVNLHIHVSRDDASSGDDSLSLELAQTTIDVEKGTEKNECKTISVAARRKGRPDIANLLTSCISQCGPEVRIGVAACGPSQMTKATRAAVYQRTFDVGPSITLHTEE
ncbi:Uncharacterized protein PECH_007184 [Penicillium ucsense]|uniref:FAD-binding FR-type domain-containing protein n=1 Tax=Penicillium ucsense TaxID=2839758 RepID=A0A8J8W8I7_9EURO|nr:Uncharacterized protein PECM_000793 [Penicillium ucsense]KAF7735114.1 Uncharacterized protein PECH_007184 [Penicillium ucsense]